MNLLIWIEETSLAEYVRVAAYGYPAMITLHSLGLAIMVGLSLVLSFRALGLYATIPYSSLHRLLKVAWVGFVINFLSGSALFTTQATTYITDFEFLLKMFLVLVGATFVALLQGVVGATNAAGGGTASVGNNLAKIYAIGTIVAWLGAMITGRLIAYL